MNHTYLNILELEEALEIFMSNIKEKCCRPTSEAVRVGDSLGRITSEAVYSVISSPHFNACAMDGIALNAASTYMATETSPVFLMEGFDFIRCDTGDPLPDKYDAVVMIEDVIECGEGKIQLVSSVSPWQHVRQIGEDICANEMILTSGTAIKAAAIGAMLAGGVSSVNVWKKPVAGLIPTGDEIVKPTNRPLPGQLIEFNTSVFSSMLSGWGAVSRNYGIMPDDLDKITNILLKAAEECDIIIINAGSSAGREDFTSKAIEAAGEVLVHGIAIKPGKPTVLGIVKGKPVIGVPGYPVSGILVMEQLVKPVVQYYLNEASGEPQKVRAVLSRKLVSSLKYKEFIRVRLGAVDDRLIATPLNRGAGVITSLVKADGILELPLNSEGIESGCEVEINLLKDMKEIRNTLVVTGSHDPLIDIISDQMRIKYPGKYVSSAHTGSMGGIMAVKRGETHAAAIHLLDEATGEYNKRYIHTYLGNERIALVTCAKRTQGLMVARGNPKNISGITDIEKQGFRYVNRQKGSGTRILLDYLLKCNDIDNSKIYGYEREEFTHMAVAALISAGSADAGMGIQAAARIYSLDFIPVCEEQYDFIIPERHLELEAVRNFLEILRSAEFRNALMSLGGYTLDKPGKIEIIADKD